VCHYNTLLPFFQPILGLNRNLIEKSGMILVKEKFQPFPAGIFLQFFLLRVVELHHVYKVMRTTTTFVAKILWGLDYTFICVFQSTFINFLYTEPTI